MESCQKSPASSIVSFVFVFVGTILWVVCGVIGIDTVSKLELITLLCRLLVFSSDSNPFCFRQRNFLKIMDPLKAIPLLIQRLSGSKDLDSMINGH